MSTEPDREQIFQYATFGTLGLTLVVLLIYGVIFINPGINLMPGMKPESPTVTVAALSLPATWTPTATRTNTATPTNTPTNTPTSTPTKTSTPTSTPTLTSTPKPTFTPTKRPATRVPTKVPTQVPTAVPPPPPTLPPYVPPTAVPPPPVTVYTYTGIKSATKTDCSNWRIYGTVWTHGGGSQPLAGVRVRIWINGQAPIDRITGSGSQGWTSPGYYQFDFAKNTGGVGFIGIVDEGGNIRSPQYPIGLDASCNPGAINQILVDFTRN